MKTKILLVDDEKDFVDALATRLEIRNFEVSIAYSGESALGIFEKVTIDIVVLDVQMPGLSGVETLLRIKEMAPLAQVIMLTGNATVENAIKGMKNGAYDFLMKPIDIDTFEEKLNEALKIKKEHDDRIRKAEVDNILNRHGW